VEYSSADMSKPDAIDEMINKVLQSFTRLDIVRNNAGIQHVAPSTNLQSRNGRPSCPSTSYGKNTELRVPSLQHLSEDLIALGS
jgi:NAD(P)-dependent dehydrogenase (short-subunit alcohol dehydrogenase family)